MRRPVALIILTALLSGAFIGAPSAASASSTLQQADSILQGMSPEERVGQLFLVTFRGSAPGPDHPIFELISRYHISGAVLKAENDNFVGAPDTLATTVELITALQSAEHAATQAPTPIPGEPESEEPSYVPLLIGISQEGNGAPGSQIRNGVTALPSLMAIGATWDPALAQQVGEVLGRELATLGFNLLLGPSLDVLADPAQVRQGDLGVRSFGGDPYWVSALGSAMIQGLHEGSEGRLGVIAKHFPGLGGSDRPIEEEVSTVRKSLVQLQQIELAPFTAVAAGAPGASEVVTDGLQTGHIRYQGFQGNIRVTTKPIGLDPEVLTQLMQVEPFASWRAGGGVTVSGALGSRAVRRFYESLGQPFRGHLVARDAFLAGNDLLYLSDFRSDEDPDQAATIRATLAFFTQKYRDDVVFAQRVDEAVARILAFKLRLYGGQFSVDQVLPPPEAAEQVGGQEQVTLETARRGATLLSPAAEAIADQVGAPPRIGERIVFLTDLRPSSQCSTCPNAPVVGLTALEDKVNALYGARAAGQVGAWNLNSLSMADLAVFLGESPPSVQPIPILPAEEVDEVIRPADWLVLLIQKSDPLVFGSDSLKLLLDRRPDLARDKRVVVFALDVPYELDATEISKVDLYYALYGKTNAFIDVAARLLFRELSATGAAPVSVPGIGYELIQATAPNPEQVISLSIADLQDSAPPGFAVGDVVEVQTGTIVDRNGNPVPDGTPVEFILAYQGDAVTFSVEYTTQSAVALAPITLDRLGVLTIRAESLPARSSDILQLNVQEGVVTIITPTLIPTVTPLPTATARPATPTPEATPPGPEEEPDETSGVHLGHLGLGLLGIAIVGSVGYTAAASWPTGEEFRLRLLLVVAAGGLLLYDYLALGLPGSQAVMDQLGAASGLVVGLVGGGAGLGAAYLWARRLAPS